MKWQVVLDSNGKYTYINEGYCVREIMSKLIEEDLF